MAEPSLAVELCGVALDNPLGLASGVLGATGSIVARVLRNGAGFATFKSVGSVPRCGHPGPVTVPYEGGWVNAVGLSNPGIEAFAAEFAAARREAPGGVLSVSVFGGGLDDFHTMVGTVDGLAPQLIELNLSCPNVGDEYGRPFAWCPDATAEVLRAVRPATRRPLLVKLTAAAPDILAVAQAAADAGADGLVCTNSLGPGMIIDVRRRRPVLANVVGGVSGAAIRPIALRAVWQLATVGLPVVAVGGIGSGLHVVEMIMAGATAVQVGSAVYGEGVAIFPRIRAELLQFMKEEGCSCLTSLCGAARAEPGADSVGVREEEP